MEKIRNILTNWINSLVKQYFSKPGKNLLNSIIYERSRARIFYGMNMTKTNAARILDRQGIKYDLLPYEVDESDLSATAVADKLNQNIDQVFKTLVLQGDNTGVFVCIIPGAEELDLKKAAHLSGNKSASMVPVKEIFHLTGYIRGGCSPIAMKKTYPAFIDESCILYDYILVSAGIRGLQLKIAPDDLIKVISCTTGDLIMIKSS